MNQKDKKTLVWVLSIIVFAGWAYVLFDMIEDRISALLALSIFIPAAISAYVMWLMRDIVPEDRIKFIRKLSHEIGEGSKGDPREISEENVPEEILPLVRRLNQMIAFQRDRYEQERDFTAHASHELRTPLAGIRLQTELAMVSKDPEQLERAHTNIIRAIDRSTRLVEQLLVLSRLTAEQNELATESVDLVALLRRLLAERQDTAKRCSIEILFKPEGPHIFVDGNEESLSIMVDNLLRNALTYSNEGGLITVSVEKKKNEALISVLDTGPGIPPEKRDMVLKRFRKADQRSKVGTGLGLSIVKRIVDLHRGRLELLDGDGGKGLLVRVALPSY